MKPASPKLFVALSCLVFLVFGLFNGAIGPVLEELSVLTNSSLAAIGGVLTFLFLGSLIAQIVAGPLTDKVGQKTVLVTSLFILGVGIAAFTNTTSLTWMFVLFLFTGLGQGGVDLGANLVVTNAYPRNNTGLLNLLHFFFGLGAFTGPALVSLVVSLNATGRLVHWIAAGLFVLLAFVFMVFYQNAKPVAHAESTAAQSSGRGLYRSPLLWMIGALLLIYVGVEYGLGSWVTAFMSRSVGMPIQQGALITSAYWGFLTLGRLAGAAVSRKLTILQLLGVSILGGLIGGVAFVFLTGTTSPAILVIIFLGFCFGTIYPTTIAITAANFPKDQGRAVGVVAAMGSVGGLALPWVAGVMLEKGSPVGYGSFVVATMVILTAIYFVTRRLVQRPRLG